MLELLLKHWIIIPNLIASAYLMFGKSFHSNMVYCIGYLLMIKHNLQIQDDSQLIYFSILEVMAVCGVILYMWKYKKPAKQKTPSCVCGYQPIGNVNLSNPPQGGSGLPQKVQKIEITVKKDEGE